MTIKSSFGVYVADNIQKSQLIFLDNCRDTTSTRNKVDSFFDWLHTCEEVEPFVERARSRIKISKAISDESTK